MRKLLFLIILAVSFTPMVQPAWADGDTYDKEERNAANAAARKAAVALIEQGVGQPLPARYSNSKLPVYLNHFQVSKDGRKIWGNRSGRLFEIDLLSGRFRTSDKVHRSLAGRLVAVSDDGSRLWTIGNHNKASGLNPPKDPRNTGKAPLFPRYLVTWRTQDLTPIGLSYPLDSSGGTPFAISADKKVYARAWKKPDGKPRERFWSFTDLETNADLLTMDALPTRNAEDMSSMHIDPVSNRFFYLGNGKIYVREWPSGKEVETLEVHDLMRPLYERERVLGLGPNEILADVSYTRLMSVKGGNEFLVCAAYYKIGGSVFFMTVIRNGQAVAWRNTANCTDRNISFSEDRSRFAWDDWIHAAEANERVLDVWDSSTLQTIKAFDVGAPFNLSEGNCGKRRPGMSFALSPDGGALYYGMEFSRFPGKNKKTKSTVLWDWQQDLPCPTFVRVFNKVRVDGGAAPASGVKILD